MTAESLSALRALPATRETLLYRVRALGVVEKISRIQSPREIDYCPAPLLPRGSGSILRAGAMRDRGVAMGARALRGGAVVCEVVWGRGVVCQVSAGW